MIRKYLNILMLVVLMCFQNNASAQLKVEKNGVTIYSKGRPYHFKADFLIIYNEQNPDLALKPSGIKKVSYNVPTWKTSDSNLADYHQADVKSSVAGDGFDDRILRSAKEGRTANLYHAGKNYLITATHIRETKDSVCFIFSEHPLFTLKAWLVKTNKSYPEVRFVLRPKKAGFYSIGYVGAPSFTKDKIAELWQPLIWTEKRVPDQPYMTPAYMATLPTTLVNDGYNSIGVMAAPKYLPFQPLPLLENSQFGIALLNNKAMVQSQVFAPMPGGVNSKMTAGEDFKFVINLIVEPSDISHTYEKIARQYFGFKDYRTNATVSMNTTLDNLIDYSKTHYAWFVDSLKGFAYSTDVPGAVKNVSSLNPLELSIVRDDKEMFEKRAYPLMEFMLSREKFLFALDSTQKIQSPSRKLKGPVALPSELGALYNTFGRNNSFYLQMAEKEFSGSRIRNLDEKQSGKSWMNAFYLFKMTGDTAYLHLSERLADIYLKQRVDKPIEQFGDPLASSNFFWPTFTNNWSMLLELYEQTGKQKYLDAAHDGARHYTLFTWMGPKIPDSLITVNKGGKAPMYWYLKSKGHHQMYYPEESVPAWRLSETGLTAESSGTSTGHRAIFMSTYAPWLLRIGYYTKDTFLIEVAKAALVGRSESFPGYHINTERTTAYEKVDFPLHEHKDQSVNSFHYNHILPMASLFIDYLVSDAFVKSKTAIDFPAEYIEAYAYLQNKMYGVQKGKFFQSTDVQLWMPGRLLHIDDIALNYISARKKDTLYLAFMNQSAKTVTTTVTVNAQLAKFPARVTAQQLFPSVSALPLTDSTFRITVPANGLAAVAIPNAQLQTIFQDQILDNETDKRSDYALIPEGNSKALLFKLGTYGQRLFVFLQDDDTKWERARLIYSIDGKKEESIDKKEYPFEFTVPMDKEKSVRFNLELTDRNGKVTSSKKITLGN